MQEPANHSSTPCMTSIFASNNSECYHLPYYLIAFSFGINAALGVPANGYIVWLSLREMMRGQSLEVFVFNTALIEVTFSVSYVFVVRQYFFGCVVCKYTTIVFGMLLLVGRPLFQCCTCVDRYLAVLHPLVFLKLKLMRYRVACAGAGWTLIFVSVLLVKLDVLVLYDVLLPQYLGFLCIKVFSCLAVLRALMRPGPGGEGRQKVSANQDKVKAFRVMEIVLASSFLTYAPMVVCLVLYYTIDYDTFLYTWSACLCSGVMLGFVQPVLYLKRVGKLRLCCHQSAADK